MPKENTSMQASKAVKNASNPVSPVSSGESDALAVIAKMPGQYRSIGEKIHAIIMKNTSLIPKTWYGLPSYANKEGKAVCYMRMNPKPPFNDRYLTFGFNESAKLDEGSMWPTVFAVKSLSPSEQSKIIALVKKAVS